MDFFTKLNALMHFWAEINASDVVSEGQSSRSWRNQLCW